MKSRHYKIVIVAQFDEDVDEAELPGRIMQDLQHEPIPKGWCQVSSMPLMPELDLNLDLAPLRDHLN